MARLIPPPRRTLAPEELERGPDRLVHITDKESVVDDGSAAVGLYIFSKRAAAWKRIHGDIQMGGFQVKAAPQIFLSYAREDEEKVENLYQKLAEAGFKPWMDKKDILPGERWKSSIRKAIQCSDFFLVCLSANSVNKRGFIQREIKNALDILQEMLDSDIYLIPVRLEDCEVPESLSDFQWVNMFEENGWTRLVKAIQVGMERRAEIVKPNIQESTPFEPYPAHEKPSLGTEMTTSREGPEWVREDHPDLGYLIVWYDRQGGIGPTPPPDALAVDGEILVETISYDVDTNTVAFWLEDSRFGTIQIHAGLRGSVPKQWKITSFSGPWRIKNLTMIEFRVIEN